MEPIYKLKSDFDPFDLYNIDGDVEDFQSARMKLAMLKAKHRVENEPEDFEILSQADHDLEKVIDLETYDERDEEPMKIFILPKVDVSKDKKLLTTIHNTYSQIFQAMIIMLDTDALFTQLPEDAEKSSKRSREFEVRLNRSVFETQQQVNIFNVIYLKIVLFKLCVFQFQFQFQYFLF